MEPSGNLVMPEPASTLAPGVDALYYFLQGASIFAFLVIIGLLTLFVIRYRRRNETDTTPRIEKHIGLEVAWTALPTVVFVFAAVWGFHIYMGMRQPPNRALEIYVTAKKWLWQFDYANGISSTNKLVVPVDQPVKLIMSSEDVIHSFFVPNFRIKQDVLPNRYTTTWFEATRTGQHNLFCTEYCGTSHSEMVGVVEVLAREDYQAWLDAGGVDPNSQDLPLAEFGEILYTAKACNTCHSLDGSKKFGPSFKGLWSKGEEQLADGSTVKIDEDYLRESILMPAAKIVGGYQPVMPAYPNLQERQLNALVEYIKTIE